MSCPEIDGDEFSFRLAQGLAGKRHPLSGSIALTHRCNLDCIHCNINVDAASAEARSSELTASQWREIFEQIATEGCLYVLLTGGDPLLRPDFVEIYDHAKRCGFVLTLFTNGTLVTPEISEHLGEWRPRLVEITLYGATAETYEKVTGVPGSYARCLRGVELLLDKEVPLRLKTMVMKTNYAEFSAMERMAESYGVGFRYDGILRPRPDASKCPEDLRLTPQEVVQLDLAHPRAIEEYAKHADRPRATDGDELYVCGAGLRGFHVDAQGCLGMCIGAPYPCYPMRDGGSFHEGWSTFILEQRAVKLTKNYECRQCPVAYLCGPCPAAAALENGDPESIVPYKCDIARLRDRAFASYRN